MHVLIDGIRIEYSVEGPRAGVPIVFVHGFPFNRSMWKPQVEALRDRFYTLTYDIRGFGASDPGDGQYSVEYFVDDLIGLLDHLRIQKAVAAGLSMGGYIVLRAAERHPDRFRGLVLADTRSEPDSNEGKIKRALQARAVKRDGMSAFADSFIPGALYRETMTRSPETAELVRRMIEGVTPVSAAGTLLALAARTDTTPALYNINVPTLILVGQHDAITPPSASAAMKEKIPESELHVLAAAAHLSNLEQPEEFNRRLIGFLDRVK